MDINGEEGLQEEELLQSTLNVDVAERLLLYGDQNNNGSLDNIAELREALIGGGFNEDKPLSLYVRDNSITHRRFFEYGKDHGRRTYSLFATPTSIEIHRGFTYKERSELSINTSSQEHYVAHLDRFEGERQLHRLASDPNVEREEAWVFISGTDKETGEEVELWFEYGEGDGKGSISENKAILMDIFDKYEVDELSTYHIHPLGLAIEEGKGACNCLEFPSHNDHQSAIMTFMDFLDRGIADFQYDDRIITPRGKIVIEPNKQELIQIR